MKRLLALLIAVCMIATMFVACTQGENKQEKKTNEEQSTQEETTKEKSNENKNKVENFNEKGFPIVNEPITLKVGIKKSPIDGSMNDYWFFNEYGKMTGVNFDVLEIQREAYDEKVNLMFASNELPDLFFGQGISTDEEIKYGSRGLIVPLNDLIDKYATNLKKYDEKIGGILGSITSPDGNIYSFPGLVTKIPNLNHSRAFVNVKWLDELDLEMPDTLNEYYEVLKAFKAKDESIVPLSGEYENWNVSPIVLSALGLPGRRSYEIPASRFGTENGKVYFVPAHDKYKKYLEYMKKLFDEELLDPEYFSQTESQLKAKGAAMRLGSFSYSASFTMVGNKEKNWSQYEVLNPITSKVNDKKMWFCEPSIRTACAVITKENKYPEATTRYIDYLYSPEGTDMLRMGPKLGEGPDPKSGWTWTDDKKYVKYVASDKYSSAWTYLNAVVAPLDANPVQNITNEAKIFGQTKQEPQQKALEEGMLGKYAPVNVTRFPDLYLSTEEQDVVNKVYYELETYLVQMEAKFIMGAEPLDKFDDYVSKMEDMGLDKLIEVYQGTYGRYLEAQGK